MKLIGLDYLGISEFFSDEELLVQNLVENLLTKKLCLQ